MAQGDIRTEIALVPGDSFFAVQPAIGEHWLIKDFFAAGDGTGRGILQYFDGADGGNHLHGATTNLHLVSYRIAHPDRDLSLPINNSLYCRVLNNSASPRKCGIAAIQIK